VRHGDAHQGSSDIAGRIGGQSNISLDNIERYKELGEGSLIRHWLIEDVRQFHQLRPYSIRQRVLEDVRLVADGGDQVVHLSARRQHLQQSVVQIIVAIQSQSDRRTAHDRHDGQGHLQAGDRVGWSGLPVAAAGHQIEEQSQQRDDQQGSRNRAQDAQAL